ncbi:MAG: hypothetical protein WDZ90_00130 [Candidatus Paceibacterota bacterium]
MRTNLLWAALVAVLFIAGPLAADEFVIPSDEGRGLWSESGPWATWLVKEQYGIDISIPSGWEVAVCNSRAYFSKPPFGFLCAIVNDRAVISYSLVRKDNTVEEVIAAQWRILGDEPNNVQNSSYQDGDVLVIESRFRVRGQLTLPLYFAFFPLEGKLSDYWLVVDVAPRFEPGNDVSTAFRQGRSWVTIPSKEVN